MQAGSSARVFSEPLTVTMGAELRFGSLASGDSDGTVTVTPDPDAPRTATPGASLLGIANFGPAEFAVTGQADAFYTITLPLTVVIEHDSGTNPPLTANNLKAFSVTADAEGPTGLIGKIGPDGTDQLFVGATLQVPANAKSGSYSGDIEITVAYE